MNKEEIKYPVHIEGSGYEEIEKKVGSLIQFDFDPHDNAHYALVMVDQKFYTLPSDSLTAMTPSEQEASNETNPG